MPNQFDIEKFYRQHNVEYITRGVNVKSGEINISCPFCNETANPDPSHHLGVKPATGEWSCWRNRGKHRGRTLHRLVMKIAQISYPEACKLLDTRQIWVEEGAFAALASDPNAIFSQKIEEKEPKILKLPLEFRKFEQKSLAFKPFSAYLSKRGFRNWQNVQDLMQDYDLRYCISDFDGRKWVNRILLPIKLDYDLVTWTGRSILREATLRYNTLSMENGAKMPITDTLFNFDQLVEEGSKQQTLFLCEGPFDALKMDFFGKRKNARATCLFGLALSSSQLGLLSELGRIYGRITVLLDAAEIDRSLKLVGQLSFLPVKVREAKLPVGIKDPGDLTEQQVYQMCV